MRRIPILLTGLVLTLVAAGPSGAEPAGRTTVDESIGLALQGGRPLPSSVAGRPRELRLAGAVSAQPERAARRRSLSYFAQLTDAQLADEASPARLELLRPGGFLGLWRPQEALGPQTFDQAVRNVNANSISPVADAAGARARLDFALYTGDLADNQQRNEIRWGVRILDGGRVDPFSGRRIGPGNRCPGAPRAVVRRLDRAVAARRYTGIQDRDDYAGARSPAGVAFYDPDVSKPRYPGLLDRAQRPFVAAGLDVPWYSARGNHDALLQGFFAVDGGARVATGCRKTFPSMRLPLRLGTPWDTMVARLRGGSFRWVPPDSRRRLAGIRAYKRLHGGADRGHGYGLVPRGELRASRGAAAYYSWSPRPGLRLVALDTVGEAGGSDGNIDHPQYRWLTRTLRAAGRRGELVVVYGHHSLQTMHNPRPDELAGRCRPARLACDADPRRSSPVHLGTGGQSSLRALLLRHRNVVLFLTGHVHRHRAAAHLRGARRGGFWEVSSASHISYPQQTRLIELMDNADGTLSIFATALDTAAPVGAPPPGTPARGLVHGELGSISRLLAARVRGGSLGAPNLELLLADPRQRSSTATGSAPE